MDPLYHITENEQNFIFYPAQHTERKLKFKICHFKSRSRKLKINKCGCFLQDGYFNTNAMGLRFALKYVHLQTVLISAVSHLHVFSK